MLKNGTTGSKGKLFAPLTFLVSSLNYYPISSTLYWRYLDILPVYENAHCPSERKSMGMFAFLTKVVKLVSGAQWKVVFRLHNFQFCEFMFILIRLPFNVVRRVCDLLHIGSFVVTCLLFDVALSARQIVSFQGIHATSFHTQGH